MNNNSASSFDIAKSRSMLLENLQEIYKTFQDSLSSSESNELRSNYESKTSGTALKLMDMKRISVNDVVTDPDMQLLICRMKTILQTPGYIKLFKKMTHELRSDMDHIIIKMVHNDMEKHEGSSTKNEEHLRLYEEIEVEKERLKRYCGSVVVDEYYEYLAIQYYLVFRKGIDNYLLNALIIAIPDSKEMEQE